MTDEQYWKGPPRLTEAYRSANLKRKEEENQALWLQGLYIYEAFTAVIHNAFRRKGTKAASYPKEPYRITPLTKEEKAELAEKERQKAIASFTAWKAAWDKKNG